jgi:hypothetical protein
MAWVAIDPTDTTDTVKVRGGKWVPVAGAKPAATTDASKMTQAQAVQQLEGGGLKSPAVDPIDVAIFGATGGASGLAEGGAKLATEQALKEGGTVAASEAFNSSAQPVINRIQQPLVRDAAQVATGLVPFVIAGAGPQAAAGALKKMGGAGEIGEAATSAATKAGEATEAAKASLDNARTKADTELDAKYEDFRQKQVPKAAEETRQETIQSTLGRTPEQTRDAQFANPADYAQRQAGIRQDILGAKNSAEKEFNDRYEKTFGPYNDKPLAMPATAAKAEQLEGWAQKNNIALDPPTRKLLDESKQLGAAEGAFKPADYGYTPKKWGQLSPEMQTQVRKMAGKMTPDIPGKPSVGTTVAQGRGLNSKWGEMAGSQGPEGYVARQMRDSVLADMDNANVPGAKQLNAEYRQFRNGGLGDYDFLGKVASPKGGDITNVAGELFDNPQRGTDFVKRLNPEQKGTFREVYGDWINKNPNKLDATHAPLLKELGFKGPLTNPEAWVYADKATTKLSDVLSTAPVAKKKFMAALEQQRGELLDQTSQDIVKDALKQAKGLGDTGARIAAKIQAAKTAPEQAKVALQEFGALDPGEQAQQAGTSAIQQFKPSETGFRGSLKRRAQIYATLALPMAAMGRTTMVGYAATLGTVAGVDSALRAALRSSLRDPDNASTFYRALVNPGAQGSLDTIARQVVQSSLPAEAAQAGQAATAKPGPMVKQVEHEKAVNIAGPRGAVSPARTSRIEDLNKDIAEGKEPEVHADLRNGRLTHTDIAKMVQPDKGGVAGLFQGMSPTQAVDAFAVADPSERELGLSALAQHLQDSAKTTDPKQMAIAMQKLKSIMAQQGATA